jgi:serine/threonine protein kinase
MFKFKNLEYILQQKYKDKKYNYEKVSNTSHTNVIRIVNKNESYIAKFIYDYSKMKGFEDMKDPRESFMNEINIYSKLPKKWGVKLVDYFDVLVEINKNIAHFYVVITSEFKNCKWKDVKDKIDYKNIVKKLNYQLNWLHKNKILHNDLELKNILISCDGKDVAIIDFEKSILNVSDKKLLQKDKDRLIKIFEEIDYLKDIM